MKLLCALLVASCAFISGCSGESAEERDLSSAAPGAREAQVPETPRQRPPEADAIMRGRR